MPPPEPPVEPPPVGGGVVVAGGVCVAGGEEGAIPEPPVPEGFGAGTGTVLLWTGVDEAV